MGLQNLKEVLRDPAPGLLEIGELVVGAGAIKGLLEGVKREPESPARHFELGKAFIQMGQQHLAIQALENGLLIDPRNTEALHNMTVALRCATNEQLNSLGISWREARERRINIYHHLLELEPNEWQNYFHRGLDLLDANRPIEARASFETAVKLASDYAPAFEYLGVSHELCGDQPAAYAAFGRAVELGGRSISLRPYIKLARLSFDQGDFESCQKIAEKGLENNRGWVTDSVAGSIALADLMILASERTGRAAAVKLSHDGIGSQDQCLGALPAELREFKVKYIVGDNPVTCRALNNSYFATIMVESPDGREFHMRLAAYGEQLDGRIAVRESGSSNSVSVDYSNLAAKDALGLFENLSKWLSAGDIEEAAAQLECLTNSCVSIHPGLATQLAQYLPGLPLGFFPDQGISVVEALSGRSRASLSVIGNGGRQSMNIVISGSGSGPFTIAYRVGVGELGVNSNLPSIEVPSLADIPAALSQLRGEE